MGSPTQALYSTDNDKRLIEIHYIYFLQLTNSAIKDYNRARMYLSDMASRLGIRVFDSISEAVQSAALMCSSLSSSNTSSSSKSCSDL